MKSFEQVEFVEEEYFRNKEIRRKKIVGKKGGEKYYCQVLSFEEIMNLVVADDHIKYKNVRLTGVQVLINQAYIICDLILLAFIISTILKAPQGASGMGGKQMGGI